MEDLLQKEHWQWEPEVGKRYIWRVILMGIAYFASWLDTQV